jgi:hypothetical protein
MSRDRRLAIVADLRRTTVRLMIAFTRSELKAAVWCLQAGLIGRPTTHRTIRMVTRLNGAALRLMHGHSAALR